jgi:hypothetical protein
MSKLKIGLLALAASFMFQGAPVQPASALSIQKPTIAAQDGVTLVRQRGDGVRHFGGGHGRHGIYGGGFRRHGFHHRRHHFYGPRFYVAPVYGYNSGCRWLKRKALYTGSHYWWRRYQRCRNDY